MASLLLINGPNLNLLGSREPGVYGATSLADVEARLQELATELGHEIAAFQSTRSTSFS
jgi:3-dehydroquinate dehydratase-2